MFCHRFLSSKASNPRENKKPTTRVFLAVGSETRNCYWIIALAATLLQKRGSTHGHAHHSHHAGNSHRGLEVGQHRNCLRRIGDSAFYVKWPWLERWIHMELGSIRTWIYTKLDLYEPKDQETCCEPSHQVAGKCRTSQMCGSADAR